MYALAFVVRLNLAILGCLSANQHAGATARVGENATRTLNDSVPIVEREKWCGLKCLWMIASASGIDVKFEAIKDLVPADDRSQGGVIDLGTLVRVASQIGVKAVAVRATHAFLNDQKAPFIAVLRLRDQGGKEALHAVLLICTTGQSVRLVDPYSPWHLQVVPLDSFCSVWTGDAVLVGDDYKAVEDNKWKAPALGMFSVNCLLAALVLWRAQPSRGRQVLVFCFSAGTLMGCNGNVSPPTTAKRTGAALVDVDASERNLGDILEGDIIKQRFTVRNASEYDCQIRAERASCSCIAVRAPSDWIAPGTAAELVMLVRTKGHVGPLVARAEITTEDRRGRIGITEKSLEVKASIIPATVAVPRSVEIPPTLVGTPGRGSFKLEMHLRSDRIEHNAEAITVTSERGIAAVRLAAASHRDTGNGVLCVAEYDVVMVPDRAGLVTRDVLTCSSKRSSYPISVEVSIPGTHPDVEVTPRSLTLGSVAARERIKLATRSLGERAVSIRPYGAALARVMTLESGAISGDDLVFAVVDVAEKTKVVHEVLELRVDDGRRPSLYVPVIGVITRGVNEQSRGTNM